MNQEQFETLSRRLPEAFVEEVVVEPDDECEIQGPGCEGVGRWQTDVVARALAGLTVAILICDVCASRRGEVI